MLNRANRAAVTAAVEALPLTSGEAVADLGFGGGVGLDLLRLRQVPEVIDRLQEAGLIVEEQRRLGEGDRVFHLLVAKPSQPAV